MRKHNIQEEVDDTLASLDHVETRRAPVDFYEKLERRLSFVEASNRRWLKKLQLGVAAMLVMSLLNGYFFLTNDASSPQETADYNDFSEVYFDTVSLIDYDDE